HGTALAEPADVPGPYVVGQPFVQVHHAHELLRVLETVIDVEIQRRAAFALLGLDEDHPVGAPGAIDGRSGGILQDLYRSDVRGVDACHVFPGHPVDDIQGAAVAVDGVHPADPDL